jgi:transposase-like protein
MTGRPKGSKSKFYTKEDKLKIIFDCIDNGLTRKEAEKKYSVAHSLLGTWIDKYKKYGIDGLENKKKTGNAYSALHTSKNISELEKMKLENLKLRIENERLKKGYTEKEVQEAHAALSKKNLK